MSDLDQIVYDPLEVVRYTKRDLGKAVALLRNSLVIDDDEARDLAEKIDRAWPNRGTLLKPPSDREFRYE